MSKNKDTLPAKWGGSTFDLAAVDGPQLPPELAEAVDESDSEGYQDDGGTYPIVKIRQKDLKDDKGKVIAPAGGFEIYDSSLSKQPPDVSGTDGLIVTIVADHNSRVYFETLTDKKPSCQSYDGVTGVGNPGGNCLHCPHGQIVDGKRGKCASQKNLVVYDHNGQAFYVLRFGPSGLKPLRNFKNLLGRSTPRIPLLAAVVRVVTVYNPEPAPHYIPGFEHIDFVSPDMLVQLREAKQLAMAQMAAPVSEPTVVDTEADIEDEETHF